MQDRLRGQVLASIPFFDQRKVIALLDGLGSMYESARVAPELYPPELPVTSCLLKATFSVKQ